MSFSCRWALGVLCALSCIGSGLSAATVTFLGSWNDQFRARYCLTAPVDIYAGWEVRLTFSTPVKHIQVYSKAIN